MGEREKFKVGDQVQLKSNGPTMTVEDVDANDHIVCQWFAGKKLERGRFAPETLKRAPAESQDHPK